MNKDGMVHDITASLNVADDCFLHKMQAVEYLLNQSEITQVDMQVWDISNSMHII
jgi:hypothetical protein